jgi:hypothetical protein
MIGVMMHIREVIQDVCLITMLVWFGWLCASLFNFCDVPSMTFTVGAIVAGIYVCSEMLVHLAVRDHLDK